MKIELNGKKQGGEKGLEAQTTAEPWPERKRPNFDFNR